MQGHTARSLALQAVRSGAQAGYQLLACVLALLGCAMLLCKAVANHASKRAAQRSRALVPSNHCTNHYHIHIG